MCNSAKKAKKNKNDNIHKNEVQQIRWSDEYWQYRVVANITEYQNQSYIGIIPESFNWIGQF